MIEKVNENCAEAAEKEDQSKAIDFIYSQIQWVQNAYKQTRSMYGRQEFHKIPQDEDESAAA